MQGHISVYMHIYTTFFFDTCRFMELAMPWLHLCGMALTSFHLPTDGPKKNPPLSPISPHPPPPTFQHFSLFANGEKWKVSTPPLP